MVSYLAFSYFGSLSRLVLFVLFRAFFFAGLLGIGLLFGLLGCWGFSLLFGCFGRYLGYLVIICVFWVGVVLYVVI